MTDFDKYDLYRQAVQDPEAALDLLRDLYRKETGRAPRLFREDFCGTGALLAEWAKRDETHRAVGIDIDATPLRYGRKRATRELGDAATRIQWHERDVLAAALPRADIACALNFSYCVFHDRARLKKYLERCRASLRPGGVFALDCLPGIEVAGSVETEMHYPEFTYFWEQAAFDPIERRGLFYIHLQPKGGKRRDRAFRYDWRLWTVPELRDLLLECGFARTEVFSGGGDVDGSCGSLSILVVAMVGGGKRKRVPRRRRGN